MQAEVDFIFLPYDSKEGKSLSESLVDELESGGWNQLRAAVAFAKNSCLQHGRLIEAMRKFAQQGGGIELTVGADIFAGNAKGSDYEAVDRLLSVFQESENAKLYLYHEEGRTFHPKVYLFSNEEEQRALLILGSSNLSDGGLRNNIEANAIIRFDLKQEAHRNKYHSITSLFTTYWTESQ